MVVHERSSIASKTRASAGRNRGSERARSHTATLGARGSRPRRGPPARVHTYAPGQVQVEIPGAQEAQQESVCERLWGLRDARLLRPAPQLDQAGLDQRRVVGQLVELFPGHWSRPHLCHARRAVRETGGGEKCGPRATLRPPPWPPPRAHSPGLPGSPVSRRCKGHGALLKEPTWCPPGLIWVTAARPRKGKPLVLNLKNGKSEKVTWDVYNQAARGLFSPFPRCPFPAVRFGIRGHCKETLKGLFN